MTLEIQPTQNYWQKQLRSSYTNGLQQLSIDNLTNWVHKKKFFFNQYFSSIH